MPEALFDIRVLYVPTTTPDGEPFAPAVARAFGIPLATAERLTREAPAYIKRGASAEVAAGMRTRLAELGAKVEVVESVGAGAAAPASRAPGPPVSAPAPGPAAAPASAAPGGSAPLPPLASGSRPPLPPLPPPEKTGFAISPLWIAAGVVALFGLGWYLVARVVMRTGDEKMLGNTPESETWCVNPYCLASMEKSVRFEGKKALVVAWRTGCLEDQDFRTFIEGLSARHRTELSIVGVGLATPTKKVARGLPTALSQPPPETFPPDGCAPAFDTLPSDQGYVVDRIPPPVAYLLDEKGKLIAVWRGGMSPDQRARLSTWLDGKPWAEH